MFRKFTLSMVLIILLVGMAACGSTNQSTPSSTNGARNSQAYPSSVITGTNTSENYQMLPAISGQVGSIKLDASANGTTQHLRKGEAISITLEANPSTGYSWFATISNADVLVQMGEPEYQQPSASPYPMLGSPENETLYFQAADVGTTTLTLEYQRGFEKGVAPEKTITITIVVE